MNTQHVRVEISRITWDEIVDGWGAEHGAPRGSDRWECGKYNREAINLDPETASALKRYLSNRVSLMRSRGFEKDEYIWSDIRAMERDIARMDTGR
jgi:hypothetical protein